jgi:hypothetical protein
MGWVTTTKEIAHFIVVLKMSIFNSARRFIGRSKNAGSFHLQ